MKPPGWISQARAERRFDIPLLLTSSEPANATKAEVCPAAFVDKNSDTLHQDVRRFFKEHLGFGDFVFRMPDGSEIGRASNLKGAGTAASHYTGGLFSVPLQPQRFFPLAVCAYRDGAGRRGPPISDNDFSDVESHRRHLVDIIADRRKRRQKGIVADFDAADADFDTEFFKIGKGSLGGKARGLAFVASLLRQNPDLVKPMKGLIFWFPRRW
jgi:hypothetical protein